MCICWTLSGSVRYLATSNNCTSDKLPRCYAKPEAACAVLGSWWWAVWCPKHVELHSKKGIIKLWYTVASCWFFNVRILQRVCFWRRKTKGWERVQLEYIVNWFQNRGQWRTLVLIIIITIITGSIKNSWNFQGYTERSKNSVDSEVSRDTCATLYNEL